MIVNSSKGIGMKKILLTLALGALSLNALAISLKDAKQQGLIGERKDGYLGYVVTPPASDVKTLVKSVNNKRKSKFSATAKKTGASMQQVEFTFYQRAVKATKAGLYYQNASGKWVKK